MFVVFILIGRGLIGLHFDWPVAGVESLISGFVFVAIVVVVNVVVVDVVVTVIVVVVVVIVVIGW